MPLRTTLAAVFLFLAGCSCHDDPTQRTLQQSIGESFAPCQEAKTKFFAAKYDVRLAFAACGHNAFSHYRWSPDGTRIYFQLVLSSYVMDAASDNRRTVPVPVSTPAGSAAWLSPTRLVVPVAADKTSPEFYLSILDIPLPEDRTQPPEITQVSRFPLPGFTKLTSVTVGARPTQLLLVGLSQNAPGTRTWFADLDTGALTPAFAWLDTSFDTLTWTPTQHALLVGKGSTVTRFHDETGEEVAHWEDATRGNLDPEGRLIALESLGEPVSVFDNPATLENPSEAQKIRNQQRIEALNAKLPRGMAAEVEPPLLSVVDTQTGERWTFENFQGDGFDWYPGRAGWASFFLWGFDRQQFHRNIAIANLGVRVEQPDEDKAGVGLTRFSPVVSPAP